MDKSNWSMSAVLETVEPLSHQFDHSQIYLHPNDHMTDISTNPAATFSLLATSSALLSNNISDSQAYHLQQHYQQQNFSPISHNSTSSSGYEELQSNLLASSFDMDNFNAVAPSTSCCVAKQLQMTNCVYQQQGLFADCVQPVTSLSFCSSIPSIVSSEFCMAASSQQRGVDESQSFGQVFDYILPSQATEYSQVVPVSSSYRRHHQEQQNSDLLIQPIHDILNEYMPCGQRLQQHQRSMYDLAHIKVENSSNGIGGRATNKQEDLVTTTTTALYANSLAQKENLFEKDSDTGGDSSYVDSTFCFSRNVNDDGGHLQTLLSAPCGTSNSCITSLQNEHISVYDPSTFLTFQHMNSTRLSSNRKRCADFEPLQIQENNSLTCFSSNPLPHSENEATIKLELECEENDVVDDDGDEVNLFMCTSNSCERSFELNTSHGQVNIGAIDSLLAPNGPFFWQYNAQSKGPKSSRALVQRNCSTREAEEQEEEMTVASGAVGDDLSAACSDADEVVDRMSIKDILTFDLLSVPQLNDPVLHVATSLHQSSSKMRKGDGNDVSANPDRLFKIGLDLHALHRKMQKIQSSADYSGLASEKARRDKNKLASKACRLKKKAQHEANKIKLHGLAREHATLRMILSSICQDLEAAASMVHSSDVAPRKPFLSNRLAYLRAAQPATSARNSLVKCEHGANVGRSGESWVAGCTDEFVLAVLCRVRQGDPNGGLSTTKSLTPKSLIVSLDAIT